MTTPKKIGFQEQNNSSARASSFLLHFFDVHGTTTTWNLLIRRPVEGVRIRRRIFQAIIETRKSPYNSTPEKSPTFDKLKGTKQMRESLKGRKFIFYSDVFTPVVVVVASSSLIAPIKIKSRHVRESKTVLDSGFHAVDSRVQLLDSRSFSVELGFRIPIVSGILDFYGCIPDSKAQGFRIPQAKFSKIAESGFPYMGRIKQC